MIFQWPLRRPFSRTINPRSVNLTVILFTVRSDLPICSAISFCVILVFDCMSDEVASDELFYWRLESYENEKSRPFRAAPVLRPLSFVRAARWWSCGISRIWPSAPRRLPETEWWPWMMPAERCRRELKWTYAVTHLPTYPLRTFAFCKFTIKCYIISFRFCNFEIADVKSG